MSNNNNNNNKDHARELKKLWNMTVTIIPNVIGAFDTVSKGLLKGMGDSMSLDIVPLLF